MENEVDYKFKVTGNYEIRIVRYITIHPESDWISYDTTNVQYIRFLSIEHAQEICHMLCLKEYEIIEYNEKDEDHYGSYKTVYRTPLIQQAVDAKEKQIEARNLQNQLTRLENRKKLESIPKREIIKSFTNGGDLLRLVKEGKDKVYCHYTFIADKVEREFYLSHYVTRGTNRFRKKVLLEDLSRWNITEEEKSELILMFDSLRKYQNELNNMVI